MAAALLTPETVTLHNIPYVRDIITQRRLLEDIGATVLTPELRTHKITAAHVELFEAPYELVKTMRASVLALGPLLTRFGEAKVRSEEHTSELQSPCNLVCRLLLEKKKTTKSTEMSNTNRQGG